jgi:hypothetical protein
VGISKNWYSKSACSMLKKNEDIQTRRYNEKRSRLIMTFLQTSGAELRLRTKDGMDVRWDVLHVLGC